MLIIEGWDSNPEALNLEVARCVACGDYCSSGDMLGWIEWGIGTPNQSQSAPLAYHVGGCAQAVETAAGAEGGGVLLDHHLDNRVSWLNNNVATPPAPGRDGLLRCRRKALDLPRTQQLLERPNSPLLRPEP
jgi:hypothetical protein